MPQSVPPPMSPLASPGATIAGKYRLDSLVGYGGMGSVWAATHLGLGHQIAIKLISQAHASTPEARRRFDTEAKAAARLKSRYVVQVYDNGELADGTPFIAMELLQGESLHRRIHRLGPVQLPEAVSLVAQVCRALSKAHAAGIIHRDIKPDNIFLAVSEDDGGTIAKVLDFGVAKLAATPGETSSTQTGSLVGTPLYMSPEQARGLKNLDHRTDLYSLALVVYTMLSGNLAFQAESFGDLLLHICTQPLPSLKQAAPWLPPAMDDWFRKAAAREPADRYPSAQEFSDAFALAAGEQPARPPFASAADNSGNVLVVPPHALGAESVTKPYTRPDLGFASANTIAGATAETPPSSVGEPAAETVVTPPRGPARGVALAVLGAALVLAVGAFALHKKGATGERAPSPAPAAATPQLPPEVRAAIERGDKEEREGRRDKAATTFASASDANPSSAELGLLAALYFRGDPRAGRAYFRRAWDARASLSARDAALLAAVEPIFQREPADLAEASKRLDDALKQFPDDGFMHYLMGSSLSSVPGQRARSLAELKKSVAIDPKQPHTLDILADSQAYAGDFPAARQAVDQCLRIAPDGLECLQEGMWEDSEQGACGRVEATARRMLAIDASYSDGIDGLANALYAQGRSLDSAREILRRRGGTPAQPTADAATDEIHVAILTGDFAAAEKRARGLAKEAQASRVLAERGAPARLLVSLLLETGRPKDADAIAREYLAGYEGWESNANLDDWAMAQEPTPLMLNVRWHQGGITRTVYEQQMAHAVADWEKRANSEVRNFIWVDAYAAPAETPDDANAALANLGTYQPIPAFKPLSLADEAIGRTFALAGRNEEALAALERATHNCFPIDHPIEHTRAHYFLGMVREAIGDKAGACAAYGVVTERWGAAKPRSVTAQSAAGRAAALHCGK
jgi:serine/threonine-protein kinase